MTEFDRHKLGRRLHEIVTTPENRRIFVDFPALKQAYSNPEAGAEAVKSRQADMRNEPNYAALAVMIGTSKSTAQVYGATSMLAEDVPGTNQSGVNLAIWLDANRPPQFHGVGHELLRMRIHWLLARRAFTGKIWTVIRPGNSGSMHVWRQRGYPVELLPVDKPKSYKDVDGIRVPRQLFVSAKTLEEMRR